MSGKGHKSRQDDQYDVYVRRKINQGLRDVEAGRTLSEMEFDQRMAKWLRMPERAP